VVVSRHGDHIVAVTSSRFPHDRLDGCAGVTARPPIAPWDLDHARSHRRANSRMTNVRRIHRTSVRILDDFVTAEETRVICGGDEHRSSAKADTPHSGL
jgi:hypothetical protein